MPDLPATHWDALLARISERYAGHRIILRERPPDEEAHLVLWCTPLRLLDTTQAEGGTTVRVTAGHEAPYIEVRFGPIEQIRLLLTSDQALDQIHLTLDDGTIAQLVFNHIW